MHGCHVMRREEHYAGRMANSIRKRGFVPLVDNFLPPKIHYMSSIRVIPHSKRIYAYLLVCRTTTCKLSKCTDFNEKYGVLLSVVC